MVLFVSGLHPPPHAPLPANPSDLPAPTPHLGPHPPHLCPQCRGHGSPCGHARGSARLWPARAPHMALPLVQLAQSKDGGGDSLGKCGQSRKGTGPLRELRGQIHGLTGSLRVGPGQQLLPSDPWSLPQAFSQRSWEMGLELPGEGARVWRLKTAPGHSTAPAPARCFQSSLRNPAGPARAGAGVGGQARGAGITPGAAHFSPLETYLS